MKGNSRGTARYYWAGCSLCKQHLLNIYTRYIYLCDIPETVLSSFSMMNFVLSLHSPLGESCSPQYIKIRALGSFMIPENSTPFTALLGVGYNSGRSPAFLWSSCLTAGRSWEFSTTPSLSGPRGALAGGSAVIRCSCQGSTGPMSNLAVSVLVQIVEALWVTVLLYFPISSCRRGPSCPLQSSAQCLVQCLACTKHIINLF